MQTLSCRSMCEAIRRMQMYMFIFATMFVIVALIANAYPEYWWILPVYVVVRVMIFIYQLQRHMEVVCGKGRC